MKLSVPIVQDLVLIGGGHSHAIALKQLGMKPIPGVRVTLITDVTQTPYSGMLPGYIAGLYSFDECHIDLRPLSQFAQTRMIVDRAMGLDLEHNRVICANRPPLRFDILSIDIGSTPTTVTIPGATEHTIPVKPISQLIKYWNQVQETVTQHPDQKIRMAIVGGGAGGVELAFSLQSCLNRISCKFQQSPNNLELHLFQRGSKLMPERHQWVRQKVEKILRQRGVQLHLSENVIQVDKKGDAKVIYCESGLSVECDRIFWVIQASATSWLRKAGLATDERGFILIDDTLRSISHPQVFAAGDIATMVNHPRPKAGVFAVRQGKPLFENLQRSLFGKPLKPFVPQKEFLILIGTGDQKAIASRGMLGWGPHSLIWRWKDYIDRQFMDQFNNLQPMSTQSEILNSEKIESNLSKMYCAGCGSKVGSIILKQVLNRIKTETKINPREDVLMGLNEAEDAAVLTVPSGKVMVQTVDYFRALLDDPFLLGKITANHCLSDLFAMGATPQSALAIATLPHASSVILEETLYQLLLGASSVLNSASALLVGGHTIEGNELAFGLTCNGLASPEKLLRKGGMKPDQVLILTKAIGTGTLFAADMQLKAKGGWIEKAIDSMLTSNQAAADCFRQYQVSACTDVTGFGLIGHLLEMIQASNVSVELNLEAISILEGAKETIQSDIFSSLHSENHRASSAIQNLQQFKKHPVYPLLFDPQTSGGLLAAVPAKNASNCLDKLKQLGYSDSCIIGQIYPELDSRPSITLSLEFSKI